MCDVTRARLHPGISSGTRPPVASPADFSTRVPVRSHLSDRGSPFAWKSSTSTARDDRCFYVLRTIRYLFTPTGDLSFLTTRRTLDLQLARGTSLFLFLLDLKFKMLPFGLQMRRKFRPHSFEQGLRGDRHHLNFMFLSIFRRTCVGLTMMRKSRRMGTESHHLMISRSATNAKWNCYPFALSRRRAWKLKCLRPIHIYMEIISHLRALISRPESHENHFLRLNYVCALLLQLWRRSPPQKWKSFLMGNCKQSSFSLYSFDTCSKVDALCLCHKKAQQIYSTMCR